MGLNSQDRKDLEVLIKELAKNAKTPLGLAHKVIPSQGNVEEFAYGMISGMVIGNFMTRFESKNGRQMDRDEMADLFSIMMVRMPQLRRAILKELGG